MGAIKFFKNDFVVMGCALLIYITSVGGWFVTAKAVRREEVIKHINEKVTLIEERLMNPTLMSELARINMSNGQMSQKKILELDDEWIVLSARNRFRETAIFQKIDQHPASLVLKKIQKEYPEFVEIFATDSHGLTFAATNPTSDLYQADELWWQEAKKRSAYFVNDIEYDESVSVWVVPISIPLYKNSIENKGRKRSAKKFLGVVKAALDIARVF